MHKRKEGGKTRYRQNQPQESRLDTAIPDKSPRGPRYTQSPHLQQHQANSADPARI